MQYGVWRIVWLVGIVACGTGRQPPPAPPRQANLALKLSSVELANGLRVVLVQDPRATEVSVTMRYQVGAADDPVDQEGVAHLVEHLMFQQVLGSQSLLARLEDVSTNFSANTTFDTTTYVERASVSHLEELLAIEAVRLGYRCTSLTESAFVRERAVVINELRQRDYALELFGAINMGLFPVGHAYRRRMGGTEAIVGAITQQQACAFADAHYGPRNAVLVVSGDLTARQLDAALGKFMVHVTKHTVVPPRAASSEVPVGRHQEAPAPIDKAAVLVAWALPESPLLQSKVRAVAPAAHAQIDSHVKGRASAVALGDARAPMVGVFVELGDNESVDDVVRNVERGIESVPDTFARSAGVVALDELSFDLIQQSAIYRLFATLEDGGDRDARLASYVLAGRDPSVALGDEFRGLRTMTRDEAATIAREHLSLSRAIITVLRPADGARSGNALKLGAAVHDLGQRRDPPDPAGAHRPAPANTSTRGFDGITTRTLANGLKVVLLPLTSVPSIDVRLVFGSGTADEPTAKRGAALVAAYALTWDLHFLNDLLLYVAAGGASDVDVALDHTAFVAQGLDMHLDLLLAGLRRRVRDGRYDDSAPIAVDVLRRESKKVDDAGALTDAWRIAQFGAGHPYSQAGLVRQSSDTLGAEDATRFRAAHYTPDNATLVIAGHFDAALADRWIDYLFGDWTGQAEKPRHQRPTPQPASIAKDIPTAQVHLRIAIPANGDHHEHQLVAAEMVASVASDVRHQLGASYGLGANLVELRLAREYLIAGAVDASRTSEAVELLRARLELLRTDADFAARTFVTARNRVLTRLVSVTGSAAMLAARVVTDVDLDRAPMSDRQTATAVQQLTIDAMTATLADLDLSHAIVMMFGPAVEVDRAFAVLGRKPTYVHATLADADARESVPTAASPTTSRRAPEIPFSDLSDAITLQGPSSRFTASLAPGYTFGSTLSHAVTGFTIAGDVGYRTDETTSAGLHLEIGQLDGSYDTMRLMVPEIKSIAIVPIALAAFAQSTAYDRLFGVVGAGLHLDRLIDDQAAPVWTTGFGIILGGGVDLVKFRGHRIAAYGRVETGLISNANYSGFTFGVAYRR